MFMPLFSIIVPIYNVAPWLDEALESLLAQTETSWEGLCIDDGSTDDSGEKLLAYVRKDPRLRATFHPNGGLSHARNRALKAVKGKYIGFFDSDDVVAPWWLEEAKQRFVETDADLVRFNCIVWRGATPPVGQRHHTTSLLKDPLAIQTWGWKVFVCEAFVWRYFLKWSRVKALTFLDEQRVKEDCLYGLQLLPHLTSVCDCASTPYYYRMRSSSLLHSTCSIDVPLQLHVTARELIRQTIPAQIERIRKTYLAQFVFQALTDWVTRIDRQEKPRYPEMRISFLSFIAEGTFTFRELVPWHWRWSVRCFLSCGWVLPMQAHSFLYRVYLKLLH